MTDPLKTCSWTLEWMCHCHWKSTSWWNLVWSSNKEWRCNFISLSIKMPTCIPSIQSLLMKWCIDWRAESMWFQIWLLTSCLVNILSGEVSVEDSKAGHNCGPTRTPNLPLICVALLTMLRSRLKSKRGQKAATQNGIYGGKEHYPSS